MLNKPWKPSVDGKAFVVPGISRIDEDLENMDGAACEALLEGGVKKRRSADHTEIAIGRINSFEETIAAKDVVAGQDADCDMRVAVRVPAEGAFVVVKAIIIVCGDNARVDKCGL
jgi:hypothetical protein